MKRYVAFVVPRHIFAENAVSRQFRAELTAGFAAARAVRARAGQRASPVRAEIDDLPGNAGWRGATPPARP